MTIPFYISHDVIATDADGCLFATAEAEDRESANVAARTLIDDGAECATIIRRRDAQVVEWQHRTIQNGVPAIRRSVAFND